MGQEALNFNINISYNNEDYIVADSNEIAYKFITTWPDWPPHIMGKVCILQGQNGSGKTHLANIWAKRACATYFSLTNNFENLDIHTNLIIEDIDHDIKLYETKLFHLINLITSKNLYILITCLNNNFPIKLPDLSSRLKSANHISISPPSDELISVILHKQLREKQLEVGSEVINYIIPRIERSFVAIHEIVEKIDKISLETRKNITIPFLREYLNI